MRRRRRRGRRRCRKRGNGVCERGREKRQRGRSFCSVVSSSSSSPSSSCSCTSSVGQNLIEGGGYSGGRVRRNVSVRQTLTEEAGERRNDALGRSLCRFRRCRCRRSSRSSDRGDGLVVLASLAASQRPRDRLCDDRFEQRRGRGRAARSRAAASCQLLLPLLPPLTLRSSFSWSAEAVAAKAHDLSAGGAPRSKGEESSPSSKKLARHDDASSASARAEEESPWSSPSSDTARTAPAISRTQGPIVELQQGPGESPSSSAAAWGQCFCFEFGERGGSRVSG